MSKSDNALGVWLLIAVVFVIGMIIKFRQYIGIGLALLSIVLAAYLWIERERYHSLQLGKRIMVVILLIICFLMGSALGLEPFVHKAAQTSPSPPVATEEVQPDTHSNNNREKAELIKQKMFDNFGGAGDPQYATSWYSLIREIRVSGDTAIVETEIFHDEEGKRAALNIANALYLLNIGGIAYVEVNDSDGFILQRKP